MATYEFAIKKETLSSGREILVPVCRKKTKFRIGSYSPLPWERIACIYGEYRLMELADDIAPELNEVACKNHIIGYQQYLTSELESEAKVEITNITQFKPVKDA